MRIAVALAASLCCLFANLATASKPVPNHPYVTSGCEGVFYARCIPAEAEGAKGTTAIYRVRKEADELVDKYDWYAKRGVHLGWSPIAGKVAVMTIGGPPTPGSEKKSELTFHLGGKHLASYTLDDLKDWGAEVWLRRLDREEQAVFKVLGCEQVPGTNDYRFVIDIQGKKLSFDILTGKLAP